MLKVKQQKAITTKNPFRKQLSEWIFNYLIRLKRKRECFFVILSKFSRRRSFVYMNVYAEKVMFFYFYFYLFVQPKEKKYENDIYTD